MRGRVGTDCDEHLEHLDGLQGLQRACVLTPLFNTRFAFVCIPW